MAEEQEKRTTNEEMDSLFRMARESSKFLGDLAKKLNSEQGQAPSGEPPVKDSEQN